MYFIFCLFKLFLFAALNWIELPELWVLFVLATTHNSQPHNIALKTTLYFYIINYFFWIKGFVLYFGLLLVLCFVSFLCCLLTWGVLLLSKQFSLVIYFIFICFLLNWIIWIVVFHAPCWWSVRLISKQIKFAVLICLFVCVCCLLTRGMLLLSKQSNLLFYFVLL